MINGRWTEPKIAFSHKEKSFGNPVFSSDGKKLFFDLEGDICFVERKSDDWIEPVKISSIINSEDQKHCEVSQKMDRFIFHVIMQKHLTKQVNMKLCF